MILMKFSFFPTEKNHCILHGHVFLTVKMGEISNLFFKSNTYVLSASVIIEYDAIITDK